MQGTCILGGTGSGKSSGSGKAIAHAFLKAGYGGLVLCATADEADTWMGYAKATGREKSFIRFDAQATHRFNFMDYTLATLGRDGFEHNLSVALMAAAEAFRASRAAHKNGGENEFFRNAAEEMINHALPLVAAAHGTIRLKQVMRFIDTAPKLADEAKAAGSKENGTYNAAGDKWWKTSFCAQTIKRCAELANQGNKRAERMVEEHADYWLIRYHEIAEKTRSSILATLTSVISGLNSGRIAELFTTDTTILPDITQEGAVIVLDLSFHEFGHMGAVAQQIFKVLWMRSMEQRPMSKDKRPVFLWNDECQYFLSADDARFLSTARRYGACPVYITQNLPTLYTAIGGDNAEYQGRTLVAQFQTRIFHSNSDPVTNEFAARIMGQVKKERESVTTNAGQSTTGNNSQSEMTGAFGGGGGESIGTTRTVIEYDDHDVRPEYFSEELRAGGKKHRFKVDAILHCAATTFRATGRGRIKITTDQRKP